MERRLTAIMATDVVGYSRLLETDEAETLAMLAEHRNEVFHPKIQEHGGRIVKLMGDGLLAEFSSAVEAMRCALAIQDALANSGSESSNEAHIQYRIGINIGDIVVDGDDIYGGGVNIASRLEGLSLPGGVCISGAVFDQVRNKVDWKFEDLGDTSLKNISEPVRVYRSIVSLRPSSGKAGNERRPPGIVLILGNAAAALLILAGGTVLWRHFSENTPLQIDRIGAPKFTAPASLDSRQTIAVLPFENRSELKDQAFFADGMTDDIITKLAKLPSLTVIARDSTFNYRETANNLSDLARALKARYLLRGSIRRSTDLVRINANLVDMSTGKLLWGDLYDGRLSDVFELQDKIAEKIVSSLSLRLGQVDRETLQRQETSNLLAYDLFLRGKERFLKFSRGDTYEGRKYLETAIELDPHFARAYAILAWTYAFEHTNGWSKDPQATLTTALELADRALALSDKLPIAHFVKGLVYRERHQYTDAIAEAQKAIEIDTNYANGYVLLATVLYYAGEPKRGLKMIEKAEKINPIHPSNYPFHKGQALFILERYKEAADAFERGLKQNPTSQRLRVWLAATYAELGRQDDAEWEADQILVADPDFKLSRLVQFFPFREVKDKERFNAALRKVGFEGRW